MNTFVKLPFVVVTRSLILLFSNIVFWSVAVILLTMLAVPAFVMWVIAAYLLSYLVISKSSLKRTTTYLFPKFPDKLKRLRSR
ncbi:MAG: thiosulfate reductase cytochrome b subunit [Paraglaciecola sp.]|jgi:thiosulfate reductase cytochrome b subunit